MIGSRSQLLAVAGVAALAAAGCGDPEAGADAGVDAGPHGQGSEARGDLIVNEVAPSGEGEDWIELLNRSDDAIDLCGWFLTDQVDRLDHFLPLGGVMPPADCAPRPLAAGAYLVVYADDTRIAEGQPIDPLHAPFQLGVADEVHLVTIDGVTGDGVLYLYPADGDGAALARQPDGEGLFFAGAPSSGEPNPEVP
jgi:hypothetical protein